MLDQYEFLIDEKGMLYQYTGDESEIIILEGVKSIGPNVFSRYGYMYVEKLITPAGVTKIGARAFYDSWVKEISLPSTLQTTEEFAFQGCENLASVTIPEGITEIEDGTFMGSGLRKVHLPKNLKRIGEKAFYSCEHLCDIDRSILETIEIGNGAFTHCKSLADESGLFILQNRLFAFNHEESEEMVEVEIPDTVTFIEDEVFDVWDTINVTMPLDCPSWRVKGSAKYNGYAESIIAYSDCTLSFRDKEGKIAAKVVLATAGEEEPVENACILSLKPKKTGGFDFAGYDSCFSKLEWSYNSIFMATARLRYPYELSQEMESEYICYLREHSVLAGEMVIEDGDMETFKVLQNHRIFNEDSVRKLLEYTQVNNYARFTAELLEYQNWEFGRKDIFASLDLSDDAAVGNSDE